jgi:rod shape-determining protein MreC
LRNIILFVRRYSNLLLFLLLQVISFYYIFTYNKYHQAAFTGTANQITGSINSKYNGLTSFFKLRSSNDSLVAANERLLNMLRQNYQMPEASYKTIVDSVRVDSLYKFTRYAYMAARVVSNTLTFENNYIVINRGTAQNVRKDMGVVDATHNVVGVVVEVSADYAVVRSLLHKKDTKLSAKLFGAGKEIGTIRWDGTETNKLNLEEIPKSATVKVGDSIITSGYSTFFPKGLIVGRIEKISAEKTSTNYNLRITSAADFYNLDYVYVIENKQQAAISEILNKVVAKDKLNN